jgi:hypothetical protein
LYKDISAGLVKNSLRCQILELLDDLFFGQSVLIAYATYAGSTTEVASADGEEFSTCVYWVLFSCRYSIFQPVDLAAMRGTQSAQN